MKNILITIILFALFYTQSVAQETAVSFCDSIKVIDARAGSKLEFFKRFSGFQQANLYTLSDSAYTVEVIYKPADVFLKEKVLISEQERINICREIESLKQNNIGLSDENYEARRRIITSSMFYGLGYYGIAMPAALSSSEPSVSVPAYMLIGGASFFIPLFVTKNQRITYGMAKGYKMGSGLGIAHGIFLGNLMGSQFTERNKTILGLSVATSIGEGLAFTYLAKNKGWTRGDVRMIGTGGYWGGSLGLTTSVLLDINSEEAFAGMGLFASTLGMFAGHQIAKKEKPADGDVSVINELGMLMAFLPLAVTLNFNDPDPDVVMISSMAGGLTGLGLGIAKTRKYNYSRFQGALIGYSELAGALTGFGLGYVVAGKDNLSSLIFTGAGATAGFIISDRLVRKYDNNESNILGKNLHFEFNPYPLLEKNKTYSENELWKMNYNYIVKVSCQF